MNDTLKLLIVVIVLSIVIAIVKVSSAKLEKQLIQLVVDQDFEGFEELVNSKKLEK